MPSSTAALRPPDPPGPSLTRRLLLRFPFKTHLYVSYLIRLCLILYGDYQDSTMLVKFTDVDYRVFTDAARHAADGRSPYDRHTYRYTPLLAWMLYPNVVVSPLFGKALFCAFDVAVGRLIYSFVKDFYRYRRPTPASAVDDLEFQARLSSFLWLYNPLVFVVSARGNAEAVAVTLVLFSLHLFYQRVFVLSGLIYGLAAHFRIYPVVFSVSFFLALSGDDGRNVWTRLFGVNRPRVRFVAGAVSALFLLTVAGYLAYGEDFLQETYFYHITRRDIRHNFSPYFYMLYLTAEEDDIGISLLTFMPQALLLLGVAWKFGTARDLPFCLFCQVAVFVVYNKVVTSQYFLWYLSLLPLSLPQIRLSRCEAVCCALLWSLMQAFWLMSAYLLEFGGNNTFLVIFLEGLSFFMANVGILNMFIRKYREVQTAVEAQWDVSKVD